MSLPRRVLSEVLRVGAVPIALPIVSLVFAIIAGLAANSGKWYEIPVVGKLAMENTVGPGVLPGS